MYFDGGAVRHNPGGPAGGHRVDLPPAGGSGLAVSGPLGGAERAMRQKQVSGGRALLSAMVKDELAHVVCTKR